MSPTKKRDGGAQLHMFAGAHHQAFGDADIRGSGRDMYNAPTVTFNIPAPTRIVSSTSTSTTSSQYTANFAKGSSVPVLTLHTSTVSSSEARAAQKGRGLLRIIRFLRAGSAGRKSSQPKSESQILDQKERSSLVSGHPSDVSGKGFAVSSIENFNIPIIEPQHLSNAELYVRSLSSSKGLACWQPEPFQPFVGEAGIVPGDVGTFTAEDGFRKTFNIWEDETSIRGSASDLLEQPYQCPVKDIVHHPGKLRVGDTVVRGASSNTTMCICDGQRRAYIFLRLPMPVARSAVLALTSPADLEKCRIGRGESLYVITGCIKSNSWALAAYKDAMTHPNDTLSLVRMGDEGVATLSFYAWTKRGTSEARCSEVTRRDTMNQSIFLRGFKLSFSSKFHANMQPSHDPHPGPSRPDDYHYSRESPDQDQEFRGHSRTSESDPTGGPGNAGGSAPSSRGTSASTGNSTGRYPLDQTNLDTFPEYRPELYHPSETINRLLLERTRADIALSHDDEWTSFMGQSTWTASLLGVLQALRNSRSVGVRNGIAFLTPRKARGSLPSMRSERVSLGLLFLGSESPTALRLNARFGVEMFVLPYAQEEFTGPARLFESSQEQTMRYTIDAWFSTLENTFAQRPSFQHCGGYCAIAYEMPPPREVEEREMQRRHSSRPFSAWKSAYHGPPHRILLLVSYLWHIVRAWDSLLEHLYTACTHAHDHAQYLSLPLTPPPPSPLSPVSCELDTVSSILTSLIRVTSQSAGRFTNTGIHQECSSLEEQLVRLEVRLKRFEGRNTTTSETGISGPPVASELDSHPAAQELSVVMTNIQTEAGTSRTIWQTLVWRYRRLVVQNPPGCRPCLQRCPWSKREATCEPVDPRRSTLAVPREANLREKKLPYRACRTSPPLRPKQALHMDAAVAG
ncbi:hypothetical protein NMY22_g7774 [Coprinellus aureogranulatus]|nr:hypothetical protein NMY22_g7774 [Coprinellus aureogranulatus]